MEINEFARMSKDRAVKNDPDGLFDWKYYVVALAGESGEIANHLKKILRGDHALDTDELAEEVADAVTYGFLLLSTLGVDPEKVLLDKYEKVNKRIAAGGFGTRPENTFEIFVNGKSVPVNDNARVWSCDAIAYLAVGHAWRPGLTIVYQGAIGPKNDGTLTGKQEVLVGQGTRFSVQFTGNA
jgi:NTP pyrophosphatase (non-canonical NTP hydrolase)